MPRPGGTERLIVPSLPHKAEGSPLIRLIGDEFATNAEASLYLLTDLTSEIGGGVLTNNNTATFAFDADHGYSVVTVDGVNQFLSRATETQFEVGTGSFIASIWFNTSATGLQHIFAYGDTAASEQEWRLFFNANNKIGAQVDDGTAVASALDSRGDIYNDGKWHHGILLWDAGTALSVYVDGELVATDTTGLPTLTLNNVGESFYIGVAENVTTKTNFFNGQLANFHLIKAADYNALQVLNQGIRESVSIGTHTLGVDTLKRLNNEFSIGSTLNDYTTTVIDIEEGTYDLQTIYEQNTPSFGTLSIQIDDKEIDSIVTLGTLADNSLSEETGIKLSGGKHILKLKDTLAGQISINFINLIKREGHEQGGATKFLLLGDEIAERANDTWTVGVLTTTFYNNVLNLSAGDADGGEFTEGSIFLKGGLYRIEYLFKKANNQGFHNLDFGNVEVLDKLDGFNSGTQNTQIKTINVRLNQGKTNIRLASDTTKNASSSDFSISTATIRGIRISD